MKTIRLFFYITLAFFLISAAGCKKAKTGSLTLQVAGTYGSQPFVLDSFYTDPAGRVLTFSTFQFYLSHIVLVKTNGSFDTVSPVSLFVFPGSTDPENLSTTINGNFDGDYKGIAFWCGVDSVQDLTPPNSIVPPNPLAGVYGMWWTMLAYQFEQVDGKWDTAQIPAFRYAFSYHVGTKPVYRYTSLSQNFSICCESNNTITIYLDVEKLFYGSSDTLNISNPQQAGTSMSPYDNPATGPDFATNFSQAFSLTKPQ